MAALYLTAGAFHLAAPGPFMRITPGWVPQPDLVIALTGLAELAGAAGLVQPWSPPLRRSAGWALMTYALCVWPANINHMLIDLAKSNHGWGLAYHLPRQLAQPLLIWAAPWSAGAFDWPWSKQTERT